MARTVLVADDSPTIQKRAQGILKGEGFEVETVSNGVAAIKKLSTIQPVVVLADVSMPGKDGYEVCDFIKNSAEFRHVPVLLVASDLEPYDEERGARVRADGKIKKPFQPEELISLVGKLAAHAEAAAPGPVAPAEVAAESLPEPPAATVEEELGIAPAKQGMRDLSSFSEGVAFAEPALEEMPAPVHEPPAPTEPLVEAEVSPAPEAVQEAAAAPMKTETRGEAPAIEGPTMTSEPVPAEEPVAAPPLSSSPSVTEQTLMFRTPSQIAEPVLSDALSLGRAGPGEEEAAPATTSLESFSLREAAEGQVRMAPSEPQVVSEGRPAAAPVPPELEVVPAAHIVSGLVHAIVRKVVAKMSPPALSPQVIEEMAAKLANEILAELNAGSSESL